MTRSLWLGGAALIVTEGTLSSGAARVSRLRVVASGLLHQARSRRSPASARPSPAGGSAAAGGRMTDDQEPPGSYEAASRA